MIEPWQVWLADLDPTEDHEQGGVRPVIVVSSAFHLRMNVYRMATIVPVTSRYRRLDYRVEIRNPKGQPNWAITDQLRSVTTGRFVRPEPWWTLTDIEIRDMQRNLLAMVAF